MMARKRPAVKIENPDMTDLQPLVRKPRHKWFAHTERLAENGWSGPHDHIEEAARAVLLAWDAEGGTCWIAQGRKLTNAEYEEQGEEYTWEVDVHHAIMLRLPGVAESVSTAARVETNFTGSMLKISVGSQEVWLTRDEALAVCDAMPSAINHMPVKI